MHERYRGTRPTCRRRVPTRPRCARIVLDLVGDVDLTNSESTYHRLATAIGRAPSDARIVLDCSALTFVDSCGLEVMALLQYAADDSDRLLTWRNVPPRIQRVLSALALEHLIKAE